MKLTHLPGTLSLLGIAFTSLHSHPGPLPAIPEPASDLPAPNAAAKGAGASGEKPVTALDPIVVTGTRTERSLAEVPIRTEVIAVTDHGVTSSPRLAEVLDWSTGLRIDNTCQNCNASEVQMLGLPQRYSAILTDGMPTFGSLAGIYGIEQIPTAFLDRIEVVKGGGSALYGPSAVAGVINLIPREPVATGGGAEFEYNIMEGDRSGNRPSLNGTVHGTVASANGKFGARVFGLNSYLQAVDINGDALTEVSRRDLWSGGFRGLWHPRSGMRLTLDYLGSHEDRRGGSAGSDLDRRPNEVPIAEETRTLQNVGTLILSGEIGPEVAYRLGFSIADVGRDSYYGGTAALGSPDPASPDYDPTWTPDRGFGETANRLYIVDALAHWSFAENHTLSGGVQWRSESLEDTQPTIGRLTDETYGNFGVVAQLESELTEPLTIVGSTRVDRHNQLDDPQFSARAAARYRVTERLRARTSIGTGFRAPEVFNEDFHITNIGGALQNIENADDLKAERSLTITAGPEWDSSEHWSVDAQGFYTWLTDTFVVEAADDPSTPDVLEFERVNGSGSSVYGLEFNLRFQHERVRALVGYVEQRLVYDEPQLFLGDPLWPNNPDPAADPNDNPVTSDAYPRVPERYGTVQVAIDLRLVELSLGGKLTGPMDVPHVITDAGGSLVRNDLSRSDWFFTLDAALVRRWDLSRESALVATAGVRNLLNDYQDDLDSGVYRDSTYVYGPRFPRTFFASLRYEF